MHSQKTPQWAANFIYADQTQSHKQNYMELESPTKSLRCIVCVLLAYVPIKMHRGRFGSFLLRGRDVIYYADEWILGDGRPQIGIREAAESGCAL